MMGGGTTRKQVEQFPDINKMCKVASCWIYIVMNLQLVDTNCLILCLSHDLPCRYAGCRMVLMLIVMLDTPCSEAV